MVCLENGKEKKISVDIVPPLPLKNSLYKCDKRFHVDDLKALLVDSTAYGVLVMTGDQSYFGRITETTQTELCKFDVSLPKKHSKGGQSSARFSRLRSEAIEHYTSKVSEKATQVFITNNLPNVQGIILATNDSAKKNQLLAKLDKRLKEIICRSIKVIYGGKNGFQQAIFECSDVFQQFAMVKQTKLLQSFMDKINTDPDKIAYGVEETIEFLEMGAVSDLIIWEEDNTDYKENEKLLDHLIENYKSFGINLHIISDITNISNMFINGFGGVGAILRFNPNV